MNDCAQRCLGGAALRQAFQNALDVAHPVCFIDVLHSGERFVVGNGGLNRRKLHKASLESIERNFVIGGKHSCQSRPMSERLGSTICAIPSCSHCGQRPFEIWVTNECASSCLRTRASSGVTDVIPSIGMRNLPSLTALLQDGAWVTSKKACPV